MDKPNKLDNKLLLRYQIGGWVPEQEVADTQGEKDPNEVSRRNCETSLQNQEALVAPDPVIVAMLKKELAALPKAKAKPAQRSEDANEKARWEMQDRIRVQKAVAEPDAFVIGLEKELATLPKV